MPEYFAWSPNLKIWASKNNELQSLLTPKSQDLGLQSLFDMPEYFAWSPNLKIWASKIQRIEKNANAQIYNK